MSSSEWIAKPFVVQSRSKTRLVILSVLGGAVAVGFLYIAVPALFESDWREAGIAFSIAFCAVGVTVYPWCNQVSSKTGPDVLDRVSGSTIRYERWGLLCLSVVMAPFASLVGFTVLLPVPLLLSFYVALASRSVRNGWVELDADGVNHRGWSFEKSARWETIGSVEIEDRKFVNKFTFWCPVVYQCVSVKPDIVLIGPARHTARVWKIEKMPIRTIDLDCRRFDVHPEALQAWISFYLHNPKMRFELGTDAAARRLASLTG